MKKKLILFDWGNIVESHTTGYTCYDAFNELFFECGYNGSNVFSLLGKYKISSIPSIDEFSNVYELISKDFNLNKSFDEFKDIYFRVFDKIDYYKDVAEFEKSLRYRCYIGIFSNLTVFDKVRLDKQVDLSKYDYVFLSFELGLEKPNIEAFNEVCNRLPFDVSDVLFIDDRKDNVDSASKIGWNVLQATGLELDKIRENCISFLNE